MLQRCENPNANTWPKYGGKGISVCAEWHHFSAFIGDMGRKPSPKHSLDRIDGTGNYTPDNCRWATYEEQNINRRNTLKERESCSKGHAYIDGSYRVTGFGVRICRVCERIRWHVRHHG